MARVLIAGCGYVGMALGTMLRARGDDVWGLRRHPDALPPGIQPLAADLGEPATLARLPARLDVVVYAAAADRRDEAAYRRAYVDGVRHLLTALDDTGTRPRVVFTSSTAVYGQRDGEWVDEESPAEPPTATGRLLLEGEHLVRDGPFPAVVLRLGGIYGPGRTRLVDAVRRGEATVTGGPPRWTNRIHRDDAAGALAHLAALPTPATLYLGVDCEPTPRDEVLRWLATRLGAPSPGVGPSTGADAQEPGSKRCRNARLVASGYRFRFPSFREGYGALIDATSRAG